MAGVTATENYQLLLGGLLADPYELYSDLRAGDPVHWSHEVQSWVLTRHRDVEFALQYDPRITAERLSRLMAQLPPTVSSGLRPLYDHLRTFVQYYDPPDHTRLRGTAARSFTPRFVERFRERIQTVIDELLDQAERVTALDLTRDFAFPLPATVIAEILGIPAGERDRFKGWADRIAAFLEGVGEDWPDAAEAANLAVVEMEAWLREQIADRRLRPREDLLTGLLVELDTGRLQERELFGWCMFLLLAGHETTTALIGNGTVALLENADRLAELRSTPEITESAVEELLRFDSPIHRISRVAIEDFEIGGRTIRSGDRIWAMIGAANRDPDQFDRPDELDLRRDPNRHLAFGYGIHFCIGAPLARLEGQLAIWALVDRYPNLRLTGPPVRRPGVSLHQYRSIPISLS